MGAPLYEGLAADLRQQLLDGKLRPGDRLPSEADLQDAHAVSRNTVRNALSMLAREGLLISGQGRGWYVRERDPLIWYADRPERGGGTDLTPNDSWSRSVREQGRQPSERIEVAILAAESRVARCLGMEVGALVVARRRLRYVDGEIFCSADTYIDHSLAAGTPIAEPGDIVPGVYAVLERLGHGWVRRSDRLVSRPATPQEAALFAVAPGDVITDHERIRYSAEGRPVAVQLLVSPGGKIIFVYEGDS